MRINSSIRYNSSSYIHHNFKIHASYSMNTVDIPVRWSWELIFLLKFECLILFKQLISLLWNYKFNNIKHRARYSLKYNRIFYKSILFLLKIIIIDSYNKKFNYLAQLSKKIVLFWKCFYIFVLHHFFLSFCLIICFYIIIKR